MTEAPLLPFVKPGMKRPPPPAACVAGSGSSVTRSSERDQAVEVVTPDRHCADLLLEFAAPMVPAELVPGAGWTVRLHPPPAGRGGWWMLEVLSLLDRWLDSVPLPCTRVLYGGRSYLIRSSIETAQHGPTSRSAFAAVHGLTH
jgi:hypothetical protein